MSDPRFMRGAPYDEQREYLIEAVRADSVAETILVRMAATELPGWRLAAGAVYQNAWNALTGRPPGYGVKDYDLVCFDPSDLSFEAEDRMIRAAADTFADIAATIEVRNQARVHLWYPARFGKEIAPITSIEDALSRYAADAHKVGLAMDPDGGYELTAPAGLDAVFDLRVTPSGDPADPEGFAAKLQRMKQLWPELKASV